MSEEKDNCPICLSPLVKYDMGEKNGYSFISCPSCGSVMTDPLITKDEINNLFAEIEPKITHAANSETITGNFRKIIKKIVPEPSSKSFIDISSRQGYAVRAAKELGFKKVKGLDSHEFFTSFSKDNYKAKDFENISVQNYVAREDMEQADVVFSIENFSEEVDLESYVEALSKIINKGGILYIQEVDGNSSSLPRKFNRWAYADPPFNFRYISKKGLKILLARHGFKIKKSIFTWGYFMRLVAVKN